MEDSFGDEFLKGKQLQLSSEPTLTSDKEQLLTFYRDRFALFDQEREEWLERLEQLRGRQEEQVKTQWELRKRMEDIGSLQKQLSDAQIQLLQERQQVLKLSAENNQLRQQERADRKKILDLLLLTEPDPTPDPSPPHISRSFSNSCSICRYCREGRGCAVHGEKHRIQKSGNRPGKMMSLPNEEMNGLKVELEGVKMMMEKERIAHEVEVRMREEDRNAREAEIKLTIEALGTKLDEASQALGTSESSRSEAIKDYLLLRHHSQLQERKQAELNQLLQSKLDHALQQLRDTAGYYHAQTKEVERIAEEQTNDFSQKFRLQVVAGEENLYVVKEQLGKLQEIYSEKIADLEGRLRTITLKYNALETRRNLEAEGHKREVEQLRTVVKKTEEDTKTADKTVKRAAEPKSCPRCQTKASKSPLANV